MFSEAIADVVRLSSLGPEERGRLVQRIADRLGADWKPGEASSAPLGLPLVHGPTGLAFSAIAGGTFDMGLTEVDLAEARTYFEWGEEFTKIFERGTTEQRPVHRVRVRPFLFGTSPLEGEEVVRFSQGLVSAPGDARFSRRQVIDVSASLGFRLPSEAELEWLCRDGGVTSFTLDAARKLDETGGDSRKLHSRFGALGLFDDQWAADDYHPTYEGAPDTSVPWMDGLGEGVCRGGCSPEYVDEPHQIVGLLASMRSNGTMARARVRLARDIPPLD